MVDQPRLELGGYGHPRAKIMETPPCEDGVIPASPLAQFSKTLIDFFGGKNMV